MSKNIFLILGGLFLIACNPSVQEIQFGVDECSFCKMAIVDKRYGAEVLTTKGKVFKYDATECMFNALCDNQHKVKEYLHSVHAINFSDPGNLANAKEGFYLISKELPSPMGAYITFFLDNQSAIDAQNEYGGEIYNWENVFLKVVGNRTCEHDL